MHWGHGWDTDLRHSLWSDEARPGLVCGEARPGKVLMRDEGTRVGYLEALGILLWYALGDAVGRRTKLKGLLLLGHHEALLRADEALLRQPRRKALLRYHEAWRRGPARLEGLECCLLLSGLARLAGLASIERGLWTARSISRSQRAGSTLRSSREALAAGRAWSRLVLGSWRDSKTLCGESPPPTCVKERRGAGSRGAGTLESCWNENMKARGEPSSQWPGSTARVRAC